MQRANLIRTGVPMLGLLATAVAIPEGAAAAVATLGIALVACMGVWWAANFLAHHARTGERAWTLWMLYPSLAAIGATLLARYVWPIWVVVALTIVALPTIAVHAMFMGQRDKEHGKPPEGAFASIVVWLPAASAYGVLAVLLAAGIGELVR